MPGEDETCYNPGILTSMSWDKTEKTFVIMAICYIPTYSEELQTLVNHYWNAMITLLLI